ncbi:MAG: hypothetical protein M3O61_03385 [Gemmatimonadota bacterium]|nr:hypothetical protein [Gemmatimonadota bacterium]
MTSALKLDRRNAMPAPMAFTDRGRTMTAAEVAAEICEGRLSAKWVIRHMAVAIGAKPGREWLFFEQDAREWWLTYLAKCRTHAGRER